MCETPPWGRVVGGEKGQAHPSPGVSVSEEAGQSGCVHFSGSLWPQSKVQTIEPEIWACHGEQHGSKVK